MAWFKKLFRKKSDYQPVITEEMRQKSADIRALNAEMRQIRSMMAQKQEIDNIKQYIAGEGGTGNKMEEMMLGMLMNAFTPKLQSSSPAAMSSISASPQRPPEKEEQNYQAAELILQKVPKNIIPILQSLPDEDLLDIRKKVIELSAGK
jgi:hypothetical protein